MAAIQDGITALVTYLLTKSDITDLVSQRVFGLELPESQSKNMPRQAIRINHAGGIRDDSYIDIQRLRLDFFCYGLTPSQADETWRTLVPILRDLERTVSSSTVLFTASHSAGPFYSRDQETEWPTVIDTWLIMIEETIVS